MTLTSQIARLPLALALPAVLTACSPNGGAPGGGKPTVAVEVERIAPTEQVDVITVVGSLAPKFAAEIKSEQQGVVEQVLVAQWLPVRRGQPLARLDVREGEVVLQKARAALDAAKAALLEAETRARQTAREAERMRQLRESGLATQQALDDAESLRTAAEAGLAAARGQQRAAEEEVRHVETRLDKAVIRAPMDGVVAERRVSPGDMVGEPGAKDGMFRVVDNRVLNLTVTAPAERLGELRVGQPLEFTVDGFAGRRFSGTVMFINPTVDEASRSVKIVAEVPNVDDALRGGLFVRGQVVVGVRSGLLQVRRGSLTSWDVEAGAAELFVVEEGVARRRAVKTGRPTSDRTPITEGLAPGDLVVVRGGFNLRDGDRVSIVQSEGE